MVMTERLQSGDVKETEIGWGQNPLDSVARVCPDMIEPFTNQAFTALSSNGNMDILHKELDKAAERLGVPKERLFVYTVRHNTSHKPEKLWTVFDEVTVDDIGPRLNKIIFPSSRFILLKSSLGDLSKVAGFGSKYQREQRIPLIFLKKRLGIQNPEELAIPNFEMASASELPDKEVYTLLAAKIALGKVNDPDTGKPFTSVHTLDAYIGRKYGVKMDFDMLKKGFMELLNYDTVKSLQHHNLINFSMIPTGETNNPQTFLETSMSWLVALSLNDKIHSQAPIHYPFPIYGNLHYAIPDPDALKYIALGHYAFLRQITYFTYGGLGLNLVKIDDDLIQLDRMLGEAFRIFQEKRIISAGETEPYRQRLQALLLNIDRKLQNVRYDLQQFSTTHQKRVSPQAYSPPDDIEVIRKIMQEGDLKQQS